MRGKFNIKVEETPENLKVLGKIYSIKKTARGKIFISVLERYFNTPEGIEVLRLFQKSQNNSSDKKNKAPESKKASVSIEKVMGDF